MSHPRTPTLLALTLVASGLAAPAHAAPAPSAPTSFTIDGLGYGHGRGMSQWGSYQQAVEGRSWRQIVGFYYPGAKTYTMDPASIRVSTRGRTGRTVRVAAEPGLVATDGTTTVKLPTTDAGRTITSWQVDRPQRGGTASSTTLWFTTAQGRKALRTTSAGKWTITATDGSVRALDASGNRVATYLGSFTGIRTADGMQPVLRTTLDDYARQVVPWENIASWPTQAQAAQAVAARSYGAWFTSHPRAELYDICDTTSCQVFGGIGQETASTRAGVELTSRVVLTVDGRALRSEFSASNGGQIAADSAGYTTVRPDPWEQQLPDSVTHWQRSVSAASLQRRWPQVGTVTGLVVTGRDGAGQWGGRVTRLRVDGTSGSVDITPTQLAALGQGWRSTYYQVTPKS